MDTQQPKLPRVTEKLGFLINRTAWQMRRHMFHFLKEHGYDLTPEQWIALNHLWQEEGVFQTELANATYRDKANVTRIIDGLARKKLAIRVMDEQDRRKFRIYLTEEGKALKDSLAPMMFEEHDRLLEGIEEKDLENIKRILKEICNNTS